MRFAPHFPIPEVDRPMDPARSLLQGIVDYAGLFPPTSATMPDAVAEYARQRDSDENWMLAAFVVPAARLDEFGAEAGRHAGTPWPLSVLLGKDFRADLERLDAWLSASGPGEAVALEFRPAGPEQIAALAAIAPPVEIFCELPWDADPGPWLGAVAACSVKAKIRCGGVTPDLIPPPDRVAGFIRACHEAGVGLKFTAGLHHPVRGVHPLTYEEGAPRAMMHGFLNVFVASALVARGDCSDLTLLAVIEETEPSAFRIDGESVAWREHSVGLDELAFVRGHFARSFGSCSFAEPVEDLQQLGML